MARKWTFIVLVMKSFPFTFKCAIWLGGVMPSHVHTQYVKRSGIFRRGVAIIIGVLNSGIAKESGEKDGGKSQAGEDLCTATAPRLDHAKGHFISSRERCSRSPRVSMCHGKQSKTSQGRGPRASAAVPRLAKYTIRKMQPADMYASE